MIKDEIHIFKDQISLSEEFTRFIIENIIPLNGEPNISLSGGSTPKVIFNYWSRNYQRALPWDKIRFFWGDERCVSPEDEMSNFGMTKAFLFNHVEVPNSNIFRIYGEDEPNGEVARYSQILLDTVPLKNNIPSFDLLMLGLGDDGHTVSIFPDQIGLWNSKDLCVVAQHPESGMNRVSITGKVVNNAQNVIFLVTGKSKAEKIRDIIHDRKNFRNQYPAALVAPVSNTIHWFIDEDAAGLL